MPPVFAARKWKLFRDWMDEDGRTIEIFVQSVPGLSYSAVSKWRSPNCHPKYIRAAAVLAIRAAHPDCPLVQQ